MLAPERAGRVGPAVLALLAGLALAVAAPAVWLSGSPPRPAPAFGQERAAQLAQRAPAPAPNVGPTAPVALPQPGVRSARLADLRPPQVDPPVEVQLAGVTADVVAVGLAPGGAVEVPADVGVAGWYRHGPAPGAAAGSAVLVGHADGAGQGLGRFARLRALEPGALVEVRLRSGATVSYEVVARERWSKAEVPVQRLFASAGPARLVLVSCAGTFDERTRTYSDNVAVTAVPLP